MGNSASYESISAALSALLYDISGQPGLKEQTLNEILNSGIYLEHREELRRIIDANGLGNAKILDTSWQSDKGGKYHTMNAATFEVDGKIFVAYRGTGDGNWPYNADSAYGYEASRMQEWAAEYFDDVMKEKYNGQEVYVTGHSQGGNNAMYTTFFSDYRRYITRYYSFDGPGFSHEIIEQAKRLNGEDYEQMRRKGYAINGHEDFVHNLGEEHTTIQDDEHVKYVDARMDDPKATHDIFSHFKEDGTLGDYRDEGAISRLCTELNNRMKERLSKEERYETGKAVMKVVENLNPGQDKLTVEMGPEDWENLKLLIPILVDVMAEQPELLETALRESGLQADYVDLVCTIINEFNLMSPENRQNLLKIIVSGLTVDRDGNLSYDGWQLLEAIIYHPEDVVPIIGDLLSEHPLIAVTLAVATPFILPLVVDLYKFAVIIDIAHNIWENIKNIAEEIKNFVLNVLSAVKQTIGKLAEWLKKAWSAKGDNFAEVNPYFKADPTLLREYARRVKEVNRRLGQLDRDLNSLYWQVGLLDIWDILCANLITSESWTLTLVMNYLNNTADRLENAERQACQYMGG